MLRARCPGSSTRGQEFHGRWCTRPLPELLAPAIGYARDGFAVSRELALTLQYAQGLFSKYTALGRALCPDGAPPAFGQVLRQPDLARTLEAIADGGRGGVL